MIVDEAPSEGCSTRCSARSDGVPFFVEELVGIDGCRDEGFVPDTLRELLLARYERCPNRRRSCCGSSRPGACASPTRMLARSTRHRRRARRRRAPVRELRRAHGRRRRLRVPARARARGDPRRPAPRRTRPVPRPVRRGLRGRGCSGHPSPRRRDLLPLARRPRCGAGVPRDDAGDARGPCRRGVRTAAQLGERALGLWDVVPDPEAAAGMGKLELMGRTASYLRNAGEGERSLALIKSALAECPRDDPNYPRLLRDKGLYLANAGKGGSVAVLEEALARPRRPRRRRAERPPRHRAHRARGRAHDRRPARRRRRDRRRALAVATEIGSPRYASIATNIAAISRADRGEVDEGLALLERARELAEGDGVRHAAILGERLRPALPHRSLPRGRAARRRGARPARAQGVERSSGVILASNAVDPLFALGEWERADELIDRALALDPPTAVHGLPPARPHLG